MAVYEGLVEGDSVQITPQGAYITRKEIISEVTGTSFERISNAITTSGHYKGEQHPVYTSSYIQTITGSALSTDTILLDISYEPMKNLPIEINISNRVASQETNKDYNDDPIFVSYTYPEGYTIDPDKVGKTETTGKTVEKQVPATTISIKKREIISGDDLIARNKTYVGYINSNSMFGDGAKNWLLTGIDSNYAGYVYESETLKFVYDVSYTYEKILGGWDCWVIFIDPQTGDPPAPASWITGTNKQVQIYGTVDFSGIL